MLQNRSYKKKRLGQHFLHDKNIAKKIAASLQSIGLHYHTLIEVGPGEGILTNYLLDLNTELYLIEIDTDLIPDLEDKFPRLKEKIINQDFLKFDFTNISGKEFGIIGNFPYNISSQILIKIIENRDRIPEMAGMFQKEMAERIASQAGHKTYGKISVFAQAFYHIEKLFNVSKNVFSPPPKVESAVIRMTRKDNYHLDCNEELFIRIVKNAFGQRRKTLRNSLHSFSDKLGNVEPSLLEKRAEMLTVEDFVSLTNQIDQNK